MSAPIDQATIGQFVGAAHGDLSTVKRMLAENPELLNALWVPFDETAIQAATQTGARDVAEFLLAQGAPLDICTAAMLGNVQKVEEFLKRDRALAHAKGSHGLPVLFHAAISGNTRIADLLLQYGGGEGKEIALHGAVHYGHADMVNWLLANGLSDVNVPNMDGKTPLTVALERGYYDIADMIQSEGGVEAG